MKGLALRDRFTGSVERFRDEMDDLVQRLFGDGAAPAARAAWAPRVDVTESDQEFLVKADLPGVPVSAVNVSVTDGVLVLKGERNEERKDEKEGFRRYERFTGSFYREISVPAGVDADKITAEATNGVVSVRLPKKPEVKPRQIPIRDAK
jgi:HSP20 family protein